MQEPHSTQVTQMLGEIEGGNRTVVDELMPVLYEELHQMAQRYIRREGRDHTLRPTALVHEAYLRLVDQNRVDWRGRAHFLAIGAQAMRRVLVDHARARNRTKRGGGLNRVLLEDVLVLSSERPEDVLAVDEVLAKLADLDPRQAQIVELRFFGGLSVAEAAEVLEVSKRTVEADWTAVKAWLRNELSDETSS